MPVDVNKDINEALLLDILSIYSDAEDKLLTAVAKRVAKGITEEGWNEKKLKNTQSLQKEIEKILSSTSKMSKAKISKGIIDAYKQGFAEVGGQKGTHDTILDELDIPMNLKMQVLATNNLLDNATFQVLRKANDAYQEVMAHSTTGLLAGVDTRIQSSQKMLNEFASKGITSFVDKAGRNWDLSSYAEMCARTVGSHAALQGHIDRQVEVGEDLVKVSTIGTTCPICQRWQGVVLSISGNNPKYHSLDEAKAAGLFHPNCKHTLGMYIPELDDNTDHEGKVEPAPLDMNSESSKRNKLIEQQRANERNIRYWKKRKALAITPEEQKKCNEKIKAWQYKNMLHCEKNGLRRQYAREGVRTGNPNGPMGTFIGGSLKEYEQMYKDVVGESPKKTFGILKMNLQFFAEKKYDKWLKDEILSLDELDIDKAMMKDASNKNVTPTTLYKKYIGDNPMQDYTLVSEYEKGTKEFKSGYAKWLKDQINEIGVSYKIKPKYVNVHEDIPIEDTKLSATEIYKKYHEGKKPTDAFKELGGEEGTGMKYGKWVETQKKELIKNGITKTVLFENSTTQKTVDTISKATETISNAKESVKKAELNAYKIMLDNSVHGNYDGYLKVKEALQDMKSKELYTDANEHEAYKLAQEKLKLAEEKHLEMVKKNAKKSWGSQQFDDDLMKLTNMLLDETDEDMHSHIDNQIKVYNDIKKANDPFAKYDKLNKYDIDVVAELLNDNNMTEIKNSLNAFQKMLDSHDESWKDYEYVKQKVEIFKEAIDGTYGMNDKEKEAFLMKKKAEEEAEKRKAEQMLKSGKVSIGREVSFKEGKLVERSKIYNELSLSDLENLSSQVVGHDLFENDNRRDILGRDRIDGHNHHMGHDVRLKSGLSDEQKKLGEAFKVAYNDYFNTIKCADINMAYLKGYENASETMKKKIDAINTCINSCELQEPILLHRYVDEDLAKAIFKTTDFKSIEKTQLFENNTFMSAATAGHPTFGKRPYMITLQCDKGTHALPTLNHEELEVLLGKGKLEFVDAKTHTSNNPYKLQNYDGSYTNFVGEEVIVRYIEDKRLEDYEVATPEKIDKMLGVKNVEHHTKESKGWIESLTEDEMLATKRYTGSWYVDMNNVYRRGDRSSESIVKLSEDLNNALRRPEIEKPVVLRRGVNSSDLAHMLGFNGSVSKMKQHLDEINEGGYAAEDKGFLSTSPYKSGGFDKDVELRIYCPASTHAAYVDSISSHKGEKETLLQSGSIFNVLKVEDVGNGHMVAYLELLGTD